MIHLTVNEVIDDAVILARNENGEGFVDMHSEDLHLMWKSLPLKNYNSYWINQIKKISNLTKKMAKLRRH